MEVKNFKKNVFLVSMGSTVLVLSYLLIFMVVNKISPFGECTFAVEDCYLYPRPLLVMLHEKLTNGESLSYQWCGGLGNDFLVCYFYAFASPFNILIYFFDYSSIDSFISLTVVFKIALSAGFFSVFLCNKSCFEKRLSLNKCIWIVAFSCCYALSNYMCAYFTQIMWLDSLMVFPIIMLGYDRVKEQNRFIIYILSLGYSVYCNYYVSFMICIFILFYYIFDEHKNIKEFLLTGLHFLGYSILSLMLSGVSLVVSYMGIMKTTSMNAEPIRHYWYGDFSLIFRQLLILSKPILASRNNIDTNIYCGTLVVFLVILYAISHISSIKEKIRRISLIVILIISMNENYINCIWHGFHQQNNVPNRFSVFLIFLLIITATEVIVKIQDINMKELFLSFGLAIIFPFVIYIFTSFNGIIDSKYIIEIYLALIVLYGGGLLGILFSKKAKRSAVSVAVGIVLVVEVLFNSFFTLKIGTFNVENVKREEKNVSDAKMIVEQTNDDIFYRSEIIGNDNCNYNALYGMKGWAAYNSTMPYNTLGFLCNMGYHLSTNNIMNHESVSVINSILGVKYIYDISPDSIYANMMEYTNVCTNKNVKVFQNMNYLPLGYGVNKEVQKLSGSFLAYPSISLDNNPMNNINCLIEAFSGKENIINNTQPEIEINFSGCNGNAYMSENQSLLIGYEVKENDYNVEIGFKPVETGEQYVALYDTNPDLVSVYINDKLIKQNKYLNQGMIGIGGVTPDDYVKVVLAMNREFQDKTCRNAEVCVRCGIVDYDVYNEVINNLKQNELRIESFEDDRIVASIDLDKDKMLFTSIPYDDGWHIYENGKEIDKICLVGAFIGADLGEGEHRIEIRHVSEGLYIGWGISFIALCIFLVIIIYNIKRNKK